MATGDKVKFGDSMCGLSPHRKHEYEMVGVNTNPSGMPVIWAVCKYCLRKERVM